MKSWTALLEAGEQDGIRPYGLEAADYLRVESGLIFVTFDYQPGELSPYELGLACPGSTPEGCARRQEAGACADRRSEALP